MKNKILLFVVRNRSFGILEFYEGKSSLTVTNHILATSYHIKLFLDFHLIIEHIIMKLHCDYTNKIKL